MKKIFKMKTGAQKLEFQKEFPLTLRIVAEGVVTFNATCFKDTSMEVYITESRVCYPKQIIDDIYELAEAEKL